MGQIKPWQLVLFVVALLVCVGSVSMFMFGGRDIKLGDRTELVDLATGDRWWVDLSGDKRATLPAKHPETGQRTIVRAFQEGDVWKSTQIEAAAGYVGRDMLIAVESFESGVLKLSDKPVKQYKPGG